MTMRESLVFGCARLTGAADMPQSRDLVNCVLAHGIRSFDTAPAYGLGTSEDALGLILRDAKNVDITTKVGLPRPLGGRVKSYLRKFKSMVYSRPPMLSSDYAASAPRTINKDADFSGELMQSSILDSLNRLQRETVGAVLLHEAYQGNASTQVVDSLRELCRRGYTERVGYSNGADLENHSVDGFPEDFICQISFSLLWLGLDAPNRKNVVLHSIAKRWVTARRSDSHLGSRIDSAASLIKGIGADALTLELAALYTIVHEIHPTARLIFSSSDLSRLNKFLSVLLFIQDADLGTELLSAWKSKV